MHRRRFVWASRKVISQPEAATRSHPASLSGDEHQVMPDHRIDDDFPESPTRWGNAASDAQQFLLAGKSAGDQQLLRCGVPHVALLLESRSVKHAERLR